MRRPDPAAVRWMILVVLLVLWEVVPLTGALPELFLPSLSKTLTVLYTDRQIYFAALLVTLYEVALSMLIACGLGILIAWWGVRLLRFAFPQQSPPFYINLSVDGATLLIVVGIAVVTGLVFGIVPSMRGTKVNLNSALRDGGLRKPTSARPAD